MHVIGRYKQLLKVVRIQSKETGFCQSTDLEKGTKKNPAALKVPKNTVASSLFTLTRSDHYQITMSVYTWFYTEQKYKRNM